jgi:hypothetical protein
MITLTDARGAMPRGPPVQDRTPHGVRDPASTTLLPRDKRIEESIRRELALGPTSLASL